MKPSTHRFILTKVLGWHITPGEDVLPPEPKTVILFAPHTSIWDAVIGFFYFRSLGDKLKIMVKKEAFFPPLSWILKLIGGFPIDRSNPQEMIVSLIHHIKESDSYYLAMCPEGTRKPVRRWKTGYHTIATQTGLPVRLAHMDFKKKEVGYGPLYELKGTAREDTDNIQKIYKSMELVPLHKDGYVTE